MIKTVNNNGFVFCLWLFFFFYNHFGIKFVTLWSDRSDDEARCLEGKFMHCVNICFGKHLRERLPASFALETITVFATTSLPVQSLVQFSVSQLVFPVFPSFPHLVLPVLCGACAPRVLSYIISAFSLTRSLRSVQSLFYHHIHTAGSQLILSSGQQWSLPQHV